MISQSSKVKVMNDPLNTATLSESLYIPCSNQGKKISRQNSISNFPAKKSEKIFKFRYPTVFCKLLKYF
jgi:hypothetical protein